MSNREGTGEGISRRPRARPRRPGRWGWRRPSRARGVLGRAPGPLRPRACCSCGDRCPWAPVRPGSCSCGDHCTQSRAPVRPGSCSCGDRCPCKANAGAAWSCSCLVEATVARICGRRCGLGLVLVVVHSSVTAPLIPLNGACPVVARARSGPRPSIRTLFLPALAEAILETKYYFSKRAS